MADRPSLLVLPERIDAVFLERPNKYLAIVNLNGDRTEAFIPNPGRMRELFIPGRKVLLRRAPENPLGARRTRYDLVAVELERRFVFIDSGVPNRFLAQLLGGDLLPELQGWNLLKKESKWGSSQFDFLLGRGEERCLLEAKCCTYVVDGIARFPDAPTTRGARHVRELTEARQAGFRSVVLFMVQGVGARGLIPNWETDPLFAATLKKAMESGVEVHARVLGFRRGRMYLEDSLPVSLSLPVASQI